MATPKLQNAYRNPSSDSEDIADLLLVTTTGLAVNGDAGSAFIVFNNGSNDVLVSSANKLPVDGSGVTQPVSAASLPLPTGAATAANQSTGNTALAAIQTAVEILDNAVAGSEIQVDIAGVTVASGRVPVDGSGVTQPVSIAATVVVDSELPAAAALADGAANPTVPAVGSSLLIFNGITWDRARGDTTNGIDVDVTRVSGNVTVVGTGTFTTQAAQNGTWTVQPGNTANTTAWLVSERPATSGGVTPHRTISAATTNATSVKGSAGQIYNLQVFSINAAARYLKLYNKATAPDVGTDTPVKTISIPGNAAVGGVVLNWPNGLEFTTGIAFALTTGVADADTAAVAANEIVVNIDYK